MGSMAYAPFQSPKNKSPPPQRHVDPQSPGWTSTTQDPYYSNEDIEILHEIVSIAQEKLEDLNGPRPLPATALFKAYDEVLPKHGVDPDDENHLSRLIFRVGGEKGSSSLPEKFQAVLASMGIALEYGEGSPLSQRESRSPRSPSDVPHRRNMENQRPSSTSPRPHGDFGELGARWPSAPSSDNETMEMEWEPAAEYVPTASISRRIVNAAGGNDTAVSLPEEGNFDIHGQAGHSSPQPTMPRFQPAVEEDLKFPDADEEIPLLRSALTRPPLLSILDRWRTASKNGNIQKKASPSLSHSSNQRAPDVEGTREADLNLISQQKPTPKARHASPSGSEVSLVEINAKQTTRSPSWPGSAAHHFQTAPREQEGEHHGDYTAMMNRASRARQIYLASRAFNHWAERTAARLEKEAVARRHMIRFRCFRGWSKAPNSKSPAVENLRAATAVQKLRRAIACQEEQLRVAASAIYATYLTQKAKRALCQWLCSTVQQNIQRETAYRAKRGVVHTWNKLTTLHKQHGESMAKHRQDLQKKHLIHFWASKTQQAERQFAISKHVGLVRPMFAHLATWWDYTEVKRRAEIYRANLVWRRAHSVLDKWNLRARAQAFVWRTDYHSATSALSKWTAAIQDGRARQCRVAHAIEQAKAPATLSRVEHFVEYINKLEIYAHRARLFIMASKFLRILDHAYEVKKASHKEEIRQQLRARYKEVSSTRKKRQFHSALALWRSSAQRHASITAQTQEHIETNTQNLKYDAVGTWIAAAKNDEEQHATGQKHAVSHILSNWREISDDLAQQDAQSWDMWLQRKQRQALKSWSISSLQGSGQEHTAAMVYQRHEADKRNRAFQTWRHSCHGNGTAYVRQMSTTPRQPSFTGRRSWRALSSRKSAVKQEAGSQYLSVLNTPATPLDTPTRWTGRPLTMPSTLAKPMPPVTEADEQSATGSSLSDEAEIGHDLAASTRNSKPGVHRNLVLRAGNTTSTTPQVPVPTNLRRRIHVRSPAFHKSTLSNVSEQLFQPTGPAIGQGQPGQKQTPGYVDSAIQTSVPAGQVSANAITSALNWRGPATPSRPSIQKITRDAPEAESPSWTQVARTAPQPSRFAGQRRHETRSAQSGLEKDMQSSLRGWK